MSFSTFFVLVLVLSIAVLVLVLSIAVLVLVLDTSSVDFVSLSNQLGPFRVRVPADA